MAGRLKGLTKIMSRKCNPCSLKPLIAVNSPNPAAISMITRPVYISMSLMNYKQRPVCKSLAAAVVSFFLDVVVDFDAEDYHRAYQCDDVGDCQRPVGNEYALYYEKERAESHHEERGDGDAIGVAGAYGGDSLWQIAEYHADGSEAAEYCCEIHDCVSLRLKTSFRHCRKEVAWMLVCNRFRGDGMNVMASCGPKPLADDLFIV